MTPKQRNPHPLRPTFQAIDLQSSFNLDSFHLPTLRSNNNGYWLSGMVWCMLYRTIGKFNKTSFCKTFSFDNQRWERLVLHFCKF